MKTHFDWHFFYRLIAVGALIGCAQCVTAKAVGKQTILKIEPLCNVRDYGAIGDGTVLDTSAINAAIRDCHSKVKLDTPHMAVVRVPPGLYRSGTIFFLDDINLEVEAGATILASENLADYPRMAHASEWRDTALLVAENLHNIALTGQGTIDGNGRAFISPTQIAYTPSFDISLTRQGQAWADRMALSREGPLTMSLRPGVLFVALNIQGLAISNIHIVDSPNWTVKIGCSNHIRVKDLDVRNNMLIPNNDALDISTSTDATVEGGYLQAGDDAIVIGGPCLDGWCSAPAAHIFVKNITLVSRSAAIRVGPALAGVHDVHFSHIIVRDSNRGILLHTRTSETVENISFDDIDIGTRLIDGPWWGAGEPISIGVALSDYVSWPKVTKMGLIRHIRFSHIKTSSGSPLVLYGMAPGHISDVHFDHLTVRMKVDPLATILGGNLDMQPTTPVNFGVQKWTITPIIVRNVEDLKFDHLQIIWQKDGDFADFYSHDVTTK